MVTGGRNEVARKQAKQALELYNRIKEKRCVEENNKEVSMIMTKLKNFGVVVLFIFAVIRLAATDVEAQLKKEKVYESLDGDVWYLLDNYCYDEYSSKEKLIVRYKIDSIPRKGSQVFIDRQRELARQGIPYEDYYANIMTFAVGCKTGVVFPESNVFCNEDKVIYAIIYDLLGWAPVGRRGCCEVFLPAPRDVVVKGTVGWKIKEKVCKEVKYSCKELMKKQ